MHSVILGSGSWGTALAQALADNKQDVIIYGKSQSEVDEIKIIKIQNFLEMFF